MRSGRRFALGDIHAFLSGLFAEEVHAKRVCSLWLLNAFAVVLLTLLGAAGEALGYDRHLKSNTAKRRTHSLFRQGCMLYELIPTMPDIRLRPLMQGFAALLLEQPVFADYFGPI